ALGEGVVEMSVMGSPGRSWVGIARTESPGSGSRRDGPDSRGCVLAYGRARGLCPVVGIRVAPVLVFGSITLARLQQDRAGEEHRHQTGDQDDELLIAEPPATADLKRIGEQRQG